MCLYRLTINIIYFHHQTIFTINNVLYVLIIKILDTQPISIDRIGVGEIKYRGYII